MVFLAFMLARDALPHQQFVGVVEYLVLYQKCLCTVSCRNVPLLFFIKIFMFLCGF